MFYQKFETFAFIKYQLTLYFSKNSPNFIIIPLNVYPSDFAFHLLKL